MRQPDWASLGLLRNPFENVARGEHLEWVDVPEAVEAAVTASPFRVQVVGEKGAGKSSVLLALAARWPKASVLYCKETSTLRGVDAPEQGLLALDEVNNAAPADLKRLGRQAAARGLSVLLGTHWDVSAHLGGGFTTVRLEKTSSLRWVQRRVAAVTAPGAVPFDFEAVAKAVQPRVGGLTYGVLRVLYELAEDLARGEVMGEALVDRAHARAAEDDTIAPAIRSAAPPAG